MRKVLPLAARSPDAHVGPMKRIGSLFSGIGGLELGLEWAGVGHTVWQVEREPFCQSVLEKHWPNAKRFDDVRMVGATNLEPVDVICGGFPCQDISYAGKGAGLAGERSGLWYEFARIVGEMGPRFVVVENVAAFITRGIGDVLGTLSDLGYDAQWRTLRASDVGAPHRRERIFIVAYARRERGQFDGACGILGGSEGTSKGDGNQWERHGDAAGDRGEDVADSNIDRPQSKRSGGILDGKREAFGDDADGCGGPEAMDNADKLDGNHGRHGTSGDSRERVDSSTIREQRAIESSLGRAAHGIPGRVARWPASPGQTQHEWEAPRTVEKAEQRAAKRRALGNAVGPQVAQEIGTWLLEIAERLPPTNIGE